VIGEEDTATSQAGWAGDIENGAMFELTPEDPELFAAGPSLDGFGGLSFLPAEDAFGGTDVAVVLQGTDGRVTEPISFRIDISPVNDPPSFEIGPDAEIEAGSGSHFLSGWATELSPGPENESTQELSVVIDSNTNPGLFQVGPVLDPTNGNLYFSIVDAVAGEATITLRIEDNGGLSGLGADNSSESASFNVVVSDSVRPTAEILFPPENAKTDADSLLVRGTAFDETTIGFVRINGLYANSDDGCATWSHDSFPASPSMSLTVQLSDTSGNFEPDADTLTVHGGQPLPLQPISMVYDSSRGRIIFYSRLYNALLGYDPADGAVTVFAEPTGALSWEITDLCYRSSPPSLFAVDDTLNCVIAFDLDSGEATLVSGLGVGAGHAFHSPKGITPVQGLNGTPPFLAVIDGSFGPDGVPALVAVSPSSGDRVTLSANAPGGLAAGSGPEFSSPAGLIYQHSERRFLLVDSSERALYSIDRETGDRVILVDAESSSDGSAWGTPSKLLVSSNGASAWVLDPAPKKVFHVDLATNTFSLLSSNSTNYSTDGHKWATPRDLARIPGSGLFLSDYTGCALFSIDTSTGARARILDYSAGDGPSWSEPTSIAVDDGAELLLVSCANDDAIYSVSLRDGTRELVTGEGLGAGPSLTDPRSVAALDGHDLVVIDVGAGQPRVLSVHRISGNRTLISGQGVGGGVSFNAANDLAVDPGTGSAYVLDGPDKTITRVSLSSGDRFRVAGGGVGLGPPLSSPTSIAWDAAGSRILVLQDQEVLTVDPLSLAREVLCSLGDFGVVVHPSSRISCPKDEACALITLPDPLSLVEVSLATGSASTLIDIAGSAGPPLADILDVATSAARQTTYFLSPESNAIFAMDAAGGGHVLLSRD